LTRRGRGRGLGRAAYEAIEAQVRRWPQVYTLRLAIVATNAEVVAFWHRMGFSETGEVRPYHYDKLLSESIIVTKPL
jgi:hypothetical protein